jgi:hypothetical protein
MTLEAFHPLEIQVLEAAGRDDDQVEADSAAVGALLAGGRYRPSLGGPLRASHYRRALADGGCLHLVVEGHAGRLHCDRFDPHRDPGTLVLHLLAEAPREALANVAAVWTVLRLLSR